MTIQEVVLLRCWTSVLLSHKKRLKVVQVEGVGWKRSTLSGEWPNGIFWERSLRLVMLRVIVVVEAR